MIMNDFEGAARVDWPDTAADLCNGGRLA